MTNNKIGYISRLEIVINDIENIAQNQSYSVINVIFNSKILIFSIKNNNIKRQRKSLQGFYFLAFFSVVGGNMLGENLKTIREEKGYSKVLLSQISGISRKTIEFIENKSASNAKLCTIEALAKALDVSVKDLLK